MAAIIVTKRCVLADGTEVREFETGADLIDVTSLTKPNPVWKWVCPKGHIVQWEQFDSKWGKQYRVANVRRLVTKQDVWQYDEYVKLEYDVCATCPRGRKAVDYTDAQIPNYSKEYIPGMRWYRLNGEDVTEERGLEVIEAMKAMQDAKTS